MNELVKGSGGEKKERICLMFSVLMRSETELRCTKVGASSSKRGKKKKECGRFLGKKFRSADLADIQDLESPAHSDDVCKI